MNLSLDITLSRNGFNLHFQGSLSAGITGLFGPSGAGKTTLLYCIAGLLRPDSGRIMLDDIVLFDNRAKINLPARKRKIGFVFQDHLLFPHLSVEKNLGFGQKETSGCKRTRLLEIAELLSIEGLLKRSVTQLSGGEKQRVALGRAILSSPGLLLLDEPFSALDHDLKRDLMSCLKRLYAATAVPMVLVSHNPEEMVEMAEELLFIRDGIIFSQGRFAESRCVPAEGRLCGSGSAMALSKMRNHMIKHHTLQLIPVPYLTNSRPSFTAEERMP